MQQNVITDNTPPKELTATEMLAILNALDDQMQTAVRDASALKETSIYADLMMGMFIGCTALTMIAFAPLAIPAAALYWICNIAWNGVDMSAAKDTYEDLKANNDEETRKAAKVGLASVGIMAASTAWSATAVALNGGQVPTTLLIGGTAAVGSAVFTGGLSFAGAMFAGAYQSHVAMEKAEKRSTYAGLKKEKNSIITEKTNKNTELQSKIDKLKSLENEPQSRTSISSESSPFLTKNLKIEKLEKQIEKIDQEIVALKKIETMECHFSQSQNKKSEATPHDVLTIDLMMAEQRNIAAAKRLDKNAYILAGVGAGLCAAAMLCPPLAIPGLILCGAAALIKSYQLSEKHHLFGLKSTVNQTSRNEREQVFLATAKNLKNNGKDGKFESVQNKLLENYCERRNLTLDNLSSDQRDKAIDLQCKHQYAEENKTWSGFLSHQWKRVEIVKSRFFTAKRRETHATAPAPAI